jgi:hypothetical protein
MKIFLNDTPINLDIIEDKLFWSVKELTEKYRELNYQYKNV